MSSIIDFPSHDQHAGRRLHIMHADNPALFDLPENLGSPDDWVYTAMQCLGLQSPGTGWDGGQTEVSRAAVSLLLMKLEELLFDGPKVTIRPED